MFRNPYAIRSVSFTLLFVASMRALESEARDLLEIAEARYKKGSIIFCSQFDVPGWRDKIGSPIIADAICDRIVHDSYRIVIECEESMRKVFGVDKADA